MSETCPKCGQGLSLTTGWLIGSGQTQVLTCKNRGCQSAPKGFIPHISYSSLSSFLTCSESWRRKYVEKEPTRSTPALVFGSAFHDTMESYITSRHTPGANKTTLTATWAAKWAVAVESDKDTEWGVDTPEDHYADGVRILTSPDVAKFADTITPLRDDSGLFMERKITLQVPGVPVPVIGYIDIVTSDGVPGDFKTSSMAWSDEKARQEIQPLFYLAALNQAGYTVPKLAFRHYVITKTKIPRLQIIENHHTWDEIFWLMTLVKSVWNGIEKEAFTLNPTSWLCTPKYCNFWSSCRGRGL